MNLDSRGYRVLAGSEPAPPRPTRADLAAIQLQLHDLLMAACVGRTLRVRAEKLIEQLVSHIEVSE